MQYCMLYYKSANSFGLRQKFLAKKQIFSVGGKKYPTCKARTIATEALRKLNAGEGEEDVKGWAKAEQAAGA